MGRVRTFSVSSTALEVARPALDRTSLVFVTSADVVMVRPGPEDATVAQGVPVGIGSIFRVEGLLAQKRWTAIRLTNDSLLGVIEEFPERLREGPSPGVDL